MHSSSALLTEPRIADPDALYEALITLNDSDKPELDRPLLAALVLVLSNHIGDSGVVFEAIQQVKAAFREPRSPQLSSAPGLT